MSSLSDPLAGLYEDEEQQPDPLVGLYAEDEPQQDEGPPIAFAKQAEESRELTPEEWQAQQNANIESYRQGQLDPIGNLLKGGLSGLSFGLSENIESLKPTEKEGDLVGNIATGTGKAIGSILPIAGLNKIFGAPLVKLAEKSPYLIKQLSSLASIVGWGATGAAEEGIHKIAKGEAPTSDDLLIHGVEWAALDAALQLAGLGGRFAMALANKATKSGKPSFKVLNETLNALKEEGVQISADERTAVKALSLLEDSGPLTGGDLKNRKVSDISIQNMERSTSDLAERYIPSEISFETEANALERAPTEDALEQFAPRTESDAQLGNNIQGDIETQFQAARDQYTPLYAQAEQAAHQAQYHIPQNTARTATTTLQDIDRVATRPQGYANVIRTIETVLEDAGFTIERDAAGQVRQAISTRDVPVNNLMELGRRLNEIIDYDVVERTIRDRLRPIVRAVKQDVRAGLAGNPEALQAFENAERLYAETAERFSTDRVRKIRSEASPEKIAKEIDSNSGLRDLRVTVSPQQYRQIEREVLQRLQNLSYEKARDLLRNIRSELSEDARRIARDIVHSKSPNAHRFRQQRIQQGILDDVANAMSTGIRPAKTLKLWKTPRGQRLVREAFHGSPNATAVEGYLRDQSFIDFADSVISTDGKIDFKKLREMMKDPGTVENLRLVGGEDAVNLFRQLESRVNQLETNAKYLKESLPSKTPTTKVQEGQGSRGRELLQEGAKKEFPYKTLIDKFLSSIGVAGQTTLNLFGIFRYGISSGAAAVLGKEALYRFAKSKAARRGFKRASHKNASRKEVTQGLIAMDKALSEE